MGSSAAGVPDEGDSLPWRRAGRGSRGRRPPRGDRERGGAAVEAALLTPVFLLIVFGLMEGAWILFGDHAIRGSASAGVRTASALANDPRLAAPAPCSQPRTESTRSDAVA